MINATILETDYQIKNQWQDVTVKEMSKAQDYINNMPIYLKNYIYSEEESPITEDKLLAFYIDWIELFSNIPRDYLESEIDVSGTGFSIIELFGLVAKFLGEPSQDDIGESEVIKLGKKEYKLIKSVKTAGGIDKMLGGATYRHFSESQALVSLFQSKKYRKWSYLAKLTAILFRENETEQYNEELIEMRAKAFENLTVSEVYRGYFFLQSLQKNLQESLITSLTLKKKGKKFIHYLKGYLVKCSGWIERITLQIKAFIINKVKRL
ncbi:MAG: hypothetical protein H8E16_16675 [Flavobacteriales bacterium]|nr:hypothetical protein [Flavobacteriales bacterium]